LNRKKAAGSSIATTLSASTHPGIIMNPFILFFIRAILGVAIAVVITRMFRGEVSAIYVTGLAVILVGLAYALEHYRKRKRP
jgi:heme/copper-type cytochrome/quinol oxidase subunit 4